MKRIGDHHLPHLSASNITFPSSEEVQVSVVYFDVICNRLIIMISYRL